MATRFVIPAEGSLVGPPAGDYQIYAHEGKLFFDFVPDAGARFSIVFSPAEAENFFGSVENARQHYVTQSMKPVTRGGAGVSSRRKAASKRPSK